MDGDRQEFFGRLETSYVCCGYVESWFFPPTWIVRIFYTIICCLWYAFSCLKQFIESDNDFISLL